MSTVRVLKQIKLGFFLYAYTYCIVLYLDLQRNANVVELQSKVVCAQKKIKPRDPSNRYKNNYV